MSLVKNAGIGPAYYMPIIKEICKHPYTYLYSIHGSIDCNTFMKYVESDDFQSIVSEAILKARRVWRMWRDTFIYFEDGIFLIRVQYNMAGLQIRYALLKDIKSELEYYHNYDSTQYLYHDIFFRKGTTHKSISKKLLEEYRNRIKNGAQI